MSNKRNNFFNLDLNKIHSNKSIYIKKIDKILQKNALLILSWIKNSWKIELIKQYILNKNTSNSYYYFNKDDDLNNKINTHLDLLKSLNDYIQLYKIPKIIVLQNISKIKWIKETISYLYKMNYKTILIWNDIKIAWINEIELINKANIENIKYGSFNLINKTEQKEHILNLLTSDILLNSIYKDFWVKSINLYKYTITYLSENNIFLSLRELHKKLDKINKISLKTTIDYIDFSIQSKIIKRCYKYDLKNNKEISSKAKYYFTDNWIRNSLVNFKLQNEILLENFIYNTLEYNNYKIFSGLNWKFDFSFYWKKKWKEIFIHISKETTKEEIKKEVNKLNKIKVKWNKYLLVNSISELSIKKVKYDDVEIVEIDELLEKLNK